MARYLFIRDGDKLKILSDSPPKVRPKRKRKTGQTSRPNVPPSDLRRPTGEGKSL